MSRRIRVLSRGRDWAIVAKPPGLPCHRSAMVNEPDTVARRARQRFGVPVHLVHRLDRAASGCLLLAFSPEAAARLHTGLRSDRATKSYLALVRGWWRWTDPVSIDAPLRAEEGDELLACETTAVGLAGGHDPRASLVEATIHTGRYHQIRRHLRAIDHPILGDSAHGDTRVNRVWRDDHGLPRLALHCAALRVPDADGTWVSARCPLPTDLHAILSAQPWWADAVAARPRLAEAPLSLQRDRRRRRR